jgi:hypothetical protein
MSGDGSEDVTRRSGVGKDSEPELCPGQGDSGRFLREDVRRVVTWLAWISNRNPLDDVLGRLLPPFMKADWSRLRMNDEI